jgi:hypothetical protein
MNFKITIGLFICGFCLLVAGTIMLQHPIDRQYQEIQIQLESSYAGLNNSDAGTDRSLELRDLSGKMERRNQLVYLKTQYHQPFHLESDPGRTKMLRDQNLLLQKMEVEIMQDLKQLRISRKMIVQQTQP